MSTRALRRLQREQEQQRLLQQVEDARKAQEDQDDDEEDGDEDDNISEPTSKVRNAFDMLEDVEEDDSEPEQIDLESELDHHSKYTPQEPAPSKPSKPKKKKKKAKKKAKDPASDPKPQNEGSGDEIDRALKEISAKGASNRWEEDPTPDHSWEAPATKLLAIDGKSLNATNEMRGLFGSVALEGETSRSNPRNQNQRRRQQNQQGGVDLATGLTGRYNVASRGKELGTLAHRRNVFMQGREEWPLAGSGGLSMEHIPDPSSFEKRYNIMHNNAYQETQMQFRAIVESMDPQAMIRLLALAPYHIATLLQVSEVCKHQGDHSVSADLLERALFSFGRSVHSSFPMALREGTARLSFAKSANRELYLTIWRYIRNLEMRGTWKTAFEWAKLLLQLNTMSDPYGVTLMIDQLALRGRSHDQLIKLASDDAYGAAWRHLPNIQISLALAHLRSKQPREARKQLALAIHHYPYIISALASALDISPLPKLLWAKLPSTDAEKLYTELYVQQAKDLWNTPETSALLVEVAESMSYYESTTSTALDAPKLEISLEEARHILLLEIPSLIALLPRRFTTMRTSSSDPLPPPSSEGDSDFTLRRPQGTDASGATAIQSIFNAAGFAAGSTSSMFQRIINWFQSPAGPNDGTNEGEEAFRELQAELGPDVQPEMIEQLLRMHLHEAEQNEDHEPVTAEGLGMAGGWDYYAEADENNSEHDMDSTGDSMPSLEDIPTRETRPAAAPTPPPHDRNPLAATVEEEDDEPDLAGTRRGNLLAGAVLRHVDDDDDDDDDDNEDEVDSDGIAAHPRRPTHTLGIPPAINPDHLRLFPPTVRSEPELEPDIEADPQRLQRWLLTTGLSEVQADGSKMTLYLRRIRLLRKQQQDWTLNMIGQRGGGVKGVADSIRRHLGS